MRTGISIFSSSRLVFPVSMLDISRMLFTTSSRSLPPDIILVRYLRWSSFSLSSMLSCNRSENPMIAFRGVLSSCVALERNSLFVLLASSATFFACISASLAFLLSVMSSTIQMLPATALSSVTTGTKLALIGVSLTPINEKEVPEKSSVFPESTVVMHLLISSLASELIRLRPMILPITFASSTPTISTKLLLH